MFTSESTVKIIIVKTEVYLHEEQFTNAYFKTVDMRCVQSQFYICFNFAVATEEDGN
jgi:hypothetical protein